MAIAAVFIALALGILIGVSFGDSFLVANQRDVIQLLEERLEQLRESGRRQEIELQRWAALQPLFRRFFDGVLAGQSICIIGPPDGEEAAVRALLEEAGAAAAVIPLSSSAGDDLAEKGASCGEAAALAALLAEGAGPEAGQPAGPGPLPEECSYLPGPPDCCLLLMEAAAYFSEEFFELLRLELQEHDLRVILLFPWCEEKSPGLLEKSGAELSLVDNIDTVWGQIALLQMIAEDIEGHYGFAKGSAGLFPEQERER